MPRPNDTVSHNTDQSTAESEWRQINIDQALLMDRTSYCSSFRLFLSIAGGGVLISMGFLDPGNIAGDIEVAQTIGLISFWILLMSHVI